MRHLTVLYDDNRKPNRKICDITGNKSFGETIFKRVSLRDRTAEMVNAAGICSEFVNIEEYDFDGRSNISFMKLYSDMAINDEKAFKVLLEKSLYAKDCYKITCRGKIAAVIYPNEEALLANDSEEDFFEIVTGAFTDLSDWAVFRRFITSGFDSRYFNELEGDEYTVIKHSANKEKLKKEYNFYGLLPDRMKMWFAMPFSFTENEKEASYSMERFHMTDLAIRYVHGAVSTDEFREILEKLFRFITVRQIKEVTDEEYLENARELYVDKVISRVELLKENPKFERLNNLIKCAASYDGLEEIVKRYISLYEKIMPKKSFKPLLVVGHGDLCFSNILYSREASFIKLIDPKGADTEDELYMNPYYDLAKLSHSICGQYDYFNSDLYEIVLDDDMHISLKLSSENDEYIEIFKEYLKKYDLDYKLIRLYETSLFLSMLPLHIDREKKVLGFVLNALRIMDEIENDL